MNFRDEWANLPHHTDPARQAAAREEYQHGLDVRRLRDVEFARRPLPDTEASDLTAQAEPLTLWEFIICTAIGVAVIAYGVLLFIGCVYGAIKLGQVMRHWK